jgi:hypothetical protein
MKLGVREAIVSPAIFAGVLLMLASVDDRVRERFGYVVSSGDGLAPWGHRLMDLGEALLAAARYHSIEHSLLVIFATVSAVLVLFMVRS